MDKIITFTNMFNVCTSKLYLQISPCRFDHPTFIQACKNEFDMWTSYTIKEQLIKEKYLEDDFHMLAIKPKLCGWLFLA